MSNLQKFKRVFLLLALLSSLQLKAISYDGFSLPKGGYQFSFPRDHGSHDHFKIEWWYITGHLFDESGRRFAFESTFFRTALKPFSKEEEEFSSDSSDFSHQTIFFADMALLDVKNQRFHFQRRWNRRGWDASASKSKLDLRNGNWSLLMNDPASETMQLIGSIQAEASWELALKPVKPLVIFGNNSISRKGEDPTAVSYYMSFPRLSLEGTLVEGTQQFHVHGEAWMDHEVSTSQLSSNQVGWNWCSLQLKDGREIMVFEMRRRDGARDPYSTLTWINQQGMLTSYHEKDFSLEPLSFWKSPLTAHSYPINMRLRTIDPVLKKSVTFLLLPLAKNQELFGSNGLSYWEGASRVINDAHEEVGSAFLELVGYGDHFEKNIQ